MNFNQAQLQTLCTIAQAAGREIMAVYDQGGAVWQKDDASPLTEADLRADAVIRQGLEAAFPSVFILSEESRSAGDAPADTFFLVDPLDGTKEFLKRNGEFTVNIALVQQGVPTAGVVFAPALGELFYAAVGLGAWMQTAGGAPQALQVAPWQPTQPLRVIGSRSHGGDKLAAWLATLNCQHSFVAAGSSLKFCRIAQGQADIYPRFGPTSQWDTAAAHCVLVVAGGAVLDLAGNPLQYGLQRQILNPEFVAVGDQTTLPPGFTPREARLPMSSGYP
ncbi:MAG: 3'(2'),5'-bisphosphate nucleotidase CysQ [Rhodoferax sp.]|nr:3'(2'),5'-bisphosphate nucleotidase CysQ [Rhodoferax sp.]